MILSIMSMWERELFQAGVDINHWDLVLDIGAFYYPGDMHVGYIYIYTYEDLQGVMGVPIKNPKQKANHKTLNLEPSSRQTNNQQLNSRQSADP